jgi:hypothetical protein
VPASCSSGPPPAIISAATTSTITVSKAPVAHAVTEKSSMVEKVLGEATGKGKREKVRPGAVKGRRKD